MPLTSTNPFDATLALQIPNRKAYDIRTLSWGTGVNVADLVISCRSNNPTVARVTERAYRNFITISALALDSGATASSTARIVIDVTDTGDSDNKKQYTILVTVTPTTVTLPPSDTENNVDSPDDLAGNTVSGVDIYARTLSDFNFTHYTEGTPWVLGSVSAGVRAQLRGNDFVRIITGATTGEYAVELTKGTETLTIEGTVLPQAPAGTGDYRNPRPLRLALGQHLRFPLAQFNWNSLTGDSDIELSDLEFVSQLDHYDQQIITVGVLAANRNIIFRPVKPGALRNGARWNVLDPDDNFLGQFVIPVAVRNVHGVVPAPPPRPRGPAEAPLPVEPQEDPAADAADINDRPAIVLPSSDRWALAHRSVGKVSEVTLEQGILSFKCADAHVVKGVKENTIRAGLGGPFQFVGRYADDGIDVAWPQSVKDQREGN